MEIGIVEVLIGIVCWHLCAEVSWFFRHWRTERAYEGLARALRKEEEQEQKVTRIK